jgi:signal transduction histidine kinase
LLNKIGIILSDAKLLETLSEMFKEDFVTVSRKDLNIADSDFFKNTDLIISDKPHFLKNLPKLKSFVMHGTGISKVPLLIISEKINLKDIEDFIDFDIKDFIQPPLVKTELIYRANSLIIYKNIFEKYNQSLIISGSLIDNLEDHVRDIEKYNNQVIEEKDKFKISIKERIKYYSDLLEQLKPGFSTLLGNCQVLSKGFAGDLESEQTKLLNIIEKTAKDLLSRVSDNIRFSGIETGKDKLLLNKVNVAFLFEVTIKKMLFYLNSNGISVETICPKGLPEVEVDIEKILEVIKGIISGFSPYFEKDCKIALEAKDPFDNFIKICITYSGKKLDIETLKKELLKYDTVQNIKGYGYPLWMCKDIVELHHGRINVSKVKPAQNMYCFTLPIDYPVSDAENID